MKTNVNVNAEHGKVSLGESVDILRESIKGMAEDIKELYDLDDDNYQKINNMKTLLEKTSRQVTELGKTIKRNHTRTVLGLCGLGGLVALGYSAFSALKEKHDEMQKEIDALKESAKKGESEESDG